MLLVGISTPKKELFAHNHRHHLNVRIIHLCGGMVDVIAGKTKITPKWIKKTRFCLALPHHAGTPSTPDPCNFNGLGRDKVCT
ncbi:MAG: WecB/TagA/CpsF family glycosyltransferase [Ignavibacteriales bacterium]|nr:WecB/TagA/CpsF family glycosyltransferase [Ignavibacteriales bacterium]